MRIAITGGKGQLGRALMTVMAQDERLCLDLPEHDITNLIALDRTLQDYRPEVVVHCAAMTDVDGCERDPDAAYRLNVLGTRNVAVTARRAGAAVVYVSTDYVFDGTKGQPYLEWDEAQPLSVYGRTKWLGEETVRQLCLQHYIVRVAWLYDERPRNFVGTVLRLAAEHDTLRMVTDEVGSPTYAADAAAAISELIRLPAYGTFHLSNSGVCSRYEWATAILEESGKSVDVTLVPSTNYAREAEVPKHVELRNFCGSQIGIVMRDWRAALAARFEQSDSG